MSKVIAEIAYDLHSGASNLRIPDFDDLHKIGMAATLAVHIKGLGEIEYELLRKVSDHFLSIPSIALESVLRLLEEVGFVRLVEHGRKIKQIIPNIPVFDDVYEALGAYTSAELELNSHEQATLAILTELQSAPRNRDTLYQTLGIEKNLFERCIKIGTSISILSEHRARGRPILISPVYFADNLDALADVAASSGARAIESALQKVKNHQGWPLSLLENQKEIGGQKLSSSELAVVGKLAEEGILRPPTIKFGQRSESFVFTPRPGKIRLNATKREIYERAMALVSAVRKGQLLPERFKIHYPLLILQKLRDRGYLKSNSEAREQYQNLVVLRVAHLKPVGADRWQLHLNRTPENEEALDLAITLLQMGSMSGMDVNQDARIALTKDEVYVQSMISAAELKRRQKEVLDEQAKAEFDQLLLKFE